MWRLLWWELRDLNAVECGEEIFKCLILFPICVSMSSQWSSDHRFSGDCLQVPMIMVSGHCGHPDTQAPDPDIDDSDQHDVMSSCLHTLYQYPAIDTLHTKCLLFTLLYYTPNLFTRYICSHQHLYNLSICQSEVSDGSQLTNEGPGPDVIVTLHNIGSQSHIPRLVTIHPSVNSLAGSGLIHFQCRFLTVIKCHQSQTHGKKNTWINIMFKYGFIHRESLNTVYWQPESGQQQ